MAKVIIIGGGFGGIAAALRMRALKHDVTLLERCKSIGGRAQVVYKDGFKFDTGPTVLTAPFLIDELFSLFNKCRKDYIKFIPLTPWYRFHFHDGSSFNYGGSVQDTLNEIQKFSPGDCKGYLRLLQKSEKIFNIAFEELSTTPFTNFTSMIRQTPNLLRLGCYQSVWRLVSSCLKNNKLRQAFSIQPLLLGGNPFNTTSIYSLIHYLERKWGIHFPLGGTEALVKSLEKLMYEEGVKVKCRETVSKIDVKNKIIKRLYTESGSEFRPDIVVSNIDPIHLYKKLIEPKAQSFAVKVKNKFSSLSMGLFVLYFGTSCTYDKIAHHTIWLGKRYKELLKDIFKHKILAEDFSLYLHRPTATDETFAPKGCDSFYVLSPVPNLSSAINWDEIAYDYGNKIIEALDKTILTGLKRNIQVCFHMTPKDFKSDYLSYLGTGFSTAPLLRQSAWFRHHNKGESVNNLYLVGAGTHPGAGLPGVLSSAKVVENLITK